MSKNNMAALQRALKGQTTIVDQPTEDVTATPMAATTYKAPSRAGKTNITAYLSPDYKASLRLIQARRNVSIQDLMAEALNDLFAKYNVPTIDDK